MYVFDLAREGAHMLYLSSEMEYDEVVAPRLPDANIWMGKRLHWQHLRFGLQDTMYIINIM